MHVDQTQNYILIIYGENSSCKDAHLTSPYYLMKNDKSFLSSTDDHYVKIPSDFLVEYFKITHGNTLIKLK